MQVLDTQDIAVSRVYCKQTDEDLQFDLGEPLELFGSRLQISVPQSYGKEWVQLIYTIMKLQLSSRFLGHFISFALQLAMMSQNMTDILGGRHLMWWCSEQSILCRFEVCIDYKNSPTATGLQWLAAEQTAGKRHPYMFSQFQPIFARTMLPCQDTPSVKHPFRAKVCITTVIWYALL